MNNNYFSSQDNQLLSNLEWHVAFIIYVCAFPTVWTERNILVEIDNMRATTYRVVFFTQPIALNQ